MIYVMRMENLSAVIVTTKFIVLCSGGSRRGSQGAMDPPFLPSSLVKVYVLRETLVLMDPPYLMNSKIILTVAHLQVFMNEFWSIACPRAQQTTQNTPFSIVSGRGHHKNGRGIKTLRARIYLEPPFLNS